MKSTATTVEEYRDELPKDRREAIEAVREIILKNLPKGYQEVLQYGMLGYVAPLSAFPAGHLNRKNEPVPYVCLSSQKNYMSIYLTTVGPLGLRVECLAMRRVNFENGTRRRARSWIWGSPAFVSRSLMTLRRT